MPLKPNQYGKPIEEDLKAKLKADVRAKLDLPTTGHGSEKSNEFLNKLDARIDNLRYPTEDEKAQLAAPNHFQSEEAAREYKNLWGCPS